MDIIALMCIYPIEIARGRNGGVKLADGSPVRRKPLGEEESALLMDLRAQLTGEKLKIMDNIILQLTAH